jgi:hypothetical protein
MSADAVRKLSPYDVPDGPGPGGDVKTNDAAGGLQTARHVGEERNPPPPAYASRLARDLGRAVAGEVDFGAQARALYAFDTSVFRQVPIGVVVPRDAADVEAALACCRDPRTCAEQMREAFSWDGPVIIECLVDQHEPPMPAKVKKNQVTMMAQALRQGTPNRNRIAQQMVKDLLDESSFAASPGHVIPGKVRPCPGSPASSATAPTTSTPPDPAP